MSDVRMLCAIVHTVNTQRELWASALHQLIIIIDGNNYFCLEIQFLCCSATIARTYLPTKYSFFFSFENVFFFNWIFFHLIISMHLWTSSPPPYGNQQTNDPKLLNLSNSHVPRPSTRYSSSARAPASALFQFEKIVSFENWREANMFKKKKCTIAECFRRNAFTCD